MAIIKLDNLDVSGLDLFSDAESFMIELVDEAEQVVGGICAGKTIFVITTKEDCRKFTCFASYPTPPQIELF
jgi:hypothetical protein